MRFKHLGISSLLLALAAVVEPLSVPRPTEAATTPPPSETVFYGCVVPSAPPQKPASALPTLPILPNGIPPPPAGWAYWKSIRSKVTAYDPSERCCGRWAEYGLTSTGDDAWILDGLAADPRAIPYRTKVWMDGTGWREIDDTGAAMRQAWRKGRYLVDLRMNSYEKARQWGRREMTLHLYRPLPR